MKTFYLVLGILGTVALIIVIGIFIGAVTGNGDGIACG